jgi:hypothetical protein
MNNRRRTAFMAAVLGALLCATYTASAAASIGANFVGRNADNTGPAATLLPDEVAGVVPQSRWTNIGTGTDVYSGNQLLLDSTGALTLVELVYSANDSWNSDTPLPLTSPDAKLMKGIQKANPDPDNDLGPTSIMTFTFRNLPQGSYDVIAYTAHNGGAPIAKFTLGATSYYVQCEVSFGGTFIQGTATTQAEATIANYVRFNDVTTDVDGQIRFTAQKVDVPQAADGIGVAGIQLIANDDVVFPPAGAPKITDPNLPSDTVAVVGATASFTVAADQGTVQWRKNGVDIPGATAFTYTTPALTLADNEAKFDAVITSAAGSVTSRQATLFVDAATPEVLARGFLNVDHYYDVGTSVLVSALLTEPKFPDSPDKRFYTGFAGLNQTNPDLSNFAARITGWVEPPVSGTYTFFLRSDDGSELYVNPTPGGNPPEVFVDALAATVQEPCCQPFQEPGDLRTSEPFALTAGQRYGITIVLKEAGGGDYVYVAWRLAGDTTPAANLLPIPGANLWGMLSGAGHRFNILQQPQSQTITEERTATVSIQIQTLPEPGEYSLQWLRNGQPIPGATSTSYKTEPLSVTDSGVQFVARMYTLFGQIDSDPATLTVVPDTFPPVPSAGAIVSRDGTTVDVGVGFDERINDTAAGVAANYSIAQGTISSFTYYPKSQSALLKVTGLAPGASTTVTVQNVADVKGNAITSVTIPVTVSTTIKWNIVGGSEGPGGVAGNYVVPVSATGFDVFSNGMTEWAAYDEATFVYEEITGDFDKKLQVIYQDLSSQWARAGLVARDVTNFGVDRATQEGGQAGRYQKVHVNPAGETLTGPGTLGNNGWEGNRRLSTGGQTSSAGGFGTQTGPLLDYPNIWVRMQRVDQTFTIYRSLDGEEWTSLGSTTWGVTLDGAAETLPMPEKLFVGPEFSPENGNVTNEADRATWLAQFRNYGDTFGSTVVPGPLSISIVDGNVRISWPGAGTLQRTATLGGTWENLPASSPFTATQEGFYRLSN